jgi:Flp pilus assembly protein protease CpaA
MGPLGMLKALLFTALIGGAMAVYTTWRLGLLGQTISNTGALVLNLVTVGRFGHRQTLRSEGAVTIPYGVAIAAGSLLARFAL